MTRHTRRGLALAGTGLAFALSAHLAGAAPATPAPDPAAVAGAPISMLIQNTGQEADQLVGASSPEAQRIALHVTRLERGQRVMHPVTAIAIPAHAVVSLEPGAAHLMLVGLRASLVQGDAFPVTLRFTLAGETTVDVRVRRKQDAAGVPEFPPVAVGTLVILHASAPPAPVPHG